MMCDTVAGAVTAIDECANANANANAENTMAPRALNKNDVFIGHPKKYTAHYHISLR
jgi:hypothetical protein